MWWAGWRRVQERYRLASVPASLRLQHHSLLPCASPACCCSARRCPGHHSSRPGRSRWPAWQPLGRTRGQCQQRRATSPAPPRRPSSRGASRSCPSRRPCQHPSAELADRSGHAAAFLPPAQCISMGGTNTALSDACKSPYVAHVSWKKHWSWHLETPPLHARKLNSRVHILSVTHGTSRPLLRCVFVLAVRLLLL